MMTELRGRSEQYRRRRHSSLWDREMMPTAIADSIQEARLGLAGPNPVMFVVEVGSVITTIAFVAGFFQGASGSTQLFAC